MPKTPLGKKQLTEFRRLLTEHRLQLLDDADHVSGSFYDRGRDHRPSQATMPMHMADVGSDNFEQEFRLELLSTEHALIREIDEALQRIDDGTYGICLATHLPIGIERLRAKPWARYCIEYARLHEQGLVPKIR